MLDDLCLLRHFSGLSGSVSFVHVRKREPVSKNSGPHFPKTTGTAKENGSREERLEAGALRQEAW